MLGGREQAGNSRGKEDSPNPADQLAQLQAAAAGQLTRYPFTLGGAIQLVATGRGVWGPKVGLLVVLVTSIR